jgi:hypothetical protein
LLHIILEVGIVRKETTDRIVPEAQFERSPRVDPNDLLEKHGSLSDHDSERVGWAEGIDVGAGGEIESPTELLILHSNALGQCIRVL